MKTLLARILLLLCLAAGLHAAPNAYFNAAATNTTVLVRGPLSVGQIAKLHGYNASNTNSSPVYIQFFDLGATAGITLGVTPPLFSLAVPANGVLDGDISLAVPFTNGIVIAVTTTAAGGSAPSTAVPLTLFYE